MNQIVLLVEDDAEDADIIGLALEKSNCPFSFIRVTNGAEAIQYLSREGIYADTGKFPKPAFMLLDLSLPKINGFGVLRWMKEQPTETMPPVIVVSYSSDERDVRLAHELGARYYLIKSVGLEGNIGLVKSLRHFWQSEFSREEGAAGHGPQNPTQ
jgi:two-component system response regulator